MAMPPNSPDKYKIAVLIDGENASPLVMDAVMADIAGFGDLVTKRMYGDFASRHIPDWRKAAEKHAIKQVHQQATITGKNSTDMALIIDAMDLLHSGSFNAFAIVSSDGDFTSLAIRLREGGMKIFGYGEKKTPEAFRNACHRFELTEKYRPAPKEKVKAAAPAAVKKAPAATAPKRKIQDVPHDKIRQAVTSGTKKDGWAHMGGLGHELEKILPEFDARNYGYKKLSDLLSSQKEFFDVEKRDKEFYVRVKP